jgi:hypothetical protein
MGSSKPSTKENEVPDPDEVCAICGDTRADHGDRHHQFSADGQLVALPKNPPRRADPPAHRDDPKPAAQQAAAFATLMEVLVEKDILNAHDVIRVFTGQG